MTWEELSELVDKHYPVAARGEGWIGLVYHASAPGSPPDTETRVKLIHVAALGRPHVAIVADVCGSQALDSTLCLRINQALPVGALEIEADRLLLRHTLPLDSLNPPALLDAILFIAQQSAHMKQTRTPSPDAHHVQRHYAD